MNLTLKEEEKLCYERLITWDIRPGDVAIVIGGYQGATCGFIMDNYPKCKLYTWEPQIEMYKVLAKKFEGNPQVKAFNHAIGLKNGSFPMIQAGSDFCSFLYDKETQKPDYVGEMHEFTEEMKKLGIKEIAWFHINIEGYEAVLIPYLVRSGWMSKIGQIVVATHGLPADVANAEMLPWWKENIGKTHNLYWSQRQFISWSRSDRKTVDMMYKLYGVKG